MGYLSWHKKRQQPELTQEMQRAGLEWREVNGDWREVCDYCKGNCGQCGITQRVGNVHTTLDAIVEPIKGLPFHGFNH